MTLELYMHHGRLDPSTGGTDEDGDAVDGWGFEGPRLLRVVGMHTTYGAMRVYFTDVAAREAARALTGWTLGHGEEDLDIVIDDGCLRIYNVQRERHEYFGDWGFGAGSPPTVENASGSFGDWVRRVERRR